MPTPPGTKGPSQTDENTLDGEAPAAAARRSVNRANLPDRVGPLSLMLASVAVMVITATVVQSCRGRPDVASAPTVAPSAPHAAEPLGAAGIPEAGTGDPAADAATLPAGTAGAGELRYTIQPGDTLSGIAEQLGVAQEALAAQNHLASADDLVAGDVLVVSLAPTGEGPLARTLPDGAFVLGPACTDFDVAAFLAAKPGRLAAFRELVDGAAMTGPHMVDRVSRDFSICPRVLLAFIDARSGWVTRQDQAVTDLDYPAGFVEPLRGGLWRQLQWLADRLNGGYYDWKTRGNRLLTFNDGQRWSGHPKLGAGSFAVQRALALQSASGDLAPRVAAFSAAYAALFGDPYEAAKMTARTGGGLLRLGPPRRAFPALALPWPKDEAWWITGGPHGAWADGSAWSALDFVADEAPLGCAVSSHWATAVAGGVVVDDGPHPGAGELLLDLDGDGKRQTGPVVFYMHLAAEGRALAGTRLRQGDVLGHPSCEGGASNATHLHLARLLDGEWLAAADPDLPFTLGQWRAYGSDHPYDGGLTGRLGAKREACECRREGVNEVRW